MQSMPSSKFKMILMKTCPFSSLARALALHNAPASSHHFGLSVISKIAAMLFVEPLLGHLLA
jgi:sorbitol-specific phosphotransferase system component IIBC